MNCCRNPNLLFLALITVVWPLSSQDAPQVEEIAIDAQAAARPFPHFWEQMFGSGRAILSLRESYRRDLARMTSATGIRYVRFHAIFDDEVGVYSEDAQGRPVYNWSYVDQIYDGLLDGGVRPFVELSFMPKALAASDKPHAFWYRPLPSPPKDYAKWEDLVYNFAKHLVDRYGADEVAQWYFEVWNEPNIDFWSGQPKQATYFELYDHAARAVKRASARLRVGGPASAQAAWIPEMIEHAMQAQVPLDFVSTHVYGNDLSKDVFGTDENIDREVMVSRAVKKVYNQVRSSARPDLPIIWSEYNASYKNEVDVTDSPFMGPWLANNIRLCDGMTAMMSHWTFSDVFEEQGVITTPFYGGFGLIAEGDVPKAAFNAFRMLHELGEQRLQPELGDALATKRADGTLAIAVWNYSAPGTTGPARQFHISVKGLDGTPQYHVEIVDRDHGSALEAWQAMSSPSSPTREQNQRLQQASKATQEINSTSSLLLPSQGLALIEVRPR
jgi:xylan 1,4-beta-xylosidase